MQADIDKLEAELAQYKLLTAAPSVHLSRGMIARVSLRLLGGTAANHASRHSRNTVVRNSPTRILAQAGGKRLVPQAYRPLGDKAQNWFSSASRVPKHMIAGIPTTHSVGVSSEAQVCQMCCSSVCQSHRILSGSPGLDEEGKALGGANCQCRDAVVCRENQKRVMTFLGSLTT